VDFDIPKINLISHWPEQICQFGALQQYSTERHEQAHKTNLMDSWNPSNHNLNYLPQEIAFQHRILCFGMAEPHLQALTHHWQNSAAACTVIPSGADVAALLNIQSYVKPEFMSFQNCCDGKHPDAKIKDFRALLDNTYDATRHAGIYRGTQEFIQHMIRNMTYISDEQLHGMALCIYHGIMVQVECLEGEHISQMCRFTGTQSRYGGDRRNDWVWVKQRSERC
jgi:hypothetical protein